MKKIPQLRWWIVVLLFGAAVLNYVDRQTLSALAPTIQHDLALSERDYANVVNLFLVAYTLAYLGSGWLTDRLGTRVGMILFVGWWSVSNALTAVATGVASLSAFRFALGLGEAGIWPAASKVVSEWFPSRERALAIGFYTMGATVGATVAPYFVISIAAWPFAERLPWVAHLLGAGTGWRMAFILTGLAGLIWLIPWSVFYRQPARSPFITDRERALILDDAKETDATNSPAWSWSQIFCSRVVWGLLITRLVTDPVWYFFQFWFAKYLHTVRGLDQQQLSITWVIYASAGVGSLLGGLLSGWRIKRGAAPATGRLQVMLGCAALLPLSPFIASTPNLTVALMLSALVVAAALSWLINLTALVVDLVPRASLGSVFGFVAAGSTVGGLIMNVLVVAMVTPTTVAPAGFLDRAAYAVAGPLLTAVQGQGYGRWFLFMAFLHPLAWLLLRFTVAPRRS